jgi:hypothetical protein
MNNKTISITGNSKAHDLPSRRESLTEALSSLFTISNHRLLSVLIFALGVASLGWVADSVLPLLQDLSAVLFSRWITGQSAKTNFLESLSKLVIPLLCFFSLIAALFGLRRKNLQPVSYNLEVPRPHEGLIVMLGGYSARGANSYASPAEIVAAINSGALDLDKIFSGCNWGQTAFVIQYHRPALKECWVITTKDKSSEQYQDAEALFKFLVEGNPDVRFMSIEIADAYDISQTAKEVSRIYRELTLLKQEELMADFTGATAAMSGGMILATLDEGRKIEYVRQDIPLTIQTAREIQAKRIIVSPQTSFQMAHRLGRKD